MMMIYDDDDDDDDDQMMSLPLRPCQSSDAIWRHTYSAAVTALSDSAVLTLTIVALMVALLLRPL